MEETKPKSVPPIFSKVVNKIASNGAVVGSYKIEVKEFKDVKFCQVTQDKPAGFGKPAVSRFITFDPKNKEFKEALSEALKS